MKFCQLFFEFAAKIKKNAVSMIRAHDQGRVDGKLQPLRLEDSTCQVTVENNLFGRKKYLNLNFV
jgi:hypothetical protein